MLSNYFSTPRFRSGRWYSTHTSAATNGTLSIANATTQYFVPALFGHRVRLDRVGTIWATAFASTSVCRLGVYRDLGGEVPQPGRLITDLGTIDATQTANTTYSITPSSPIELKAGLYWFALSIQVANATGALRADHRLAGPGAGGLVFPLGADGTAPGSQAAVNTVGGFTRASVSGAFSDVTSATALTPVLGNTPLVLFRTV